MNKNEKSKEIYNYFLKLIDAIYDSYKYLLTYEDYTLLVLEEISKLQDNYLNEDYQKELKRKIILKLSQKISEELNSKNSFTLINNYINIKLKDISNLNNCLENFNILNNFFIKYDFTPNPNIMCELINNNEIFNKMINNIFKKYQKQIVSGKIENLFDNDLLLLAIDTYCMINDIEIKELDNFKNDEPDYKFPDSVKMYLKEIGNKKLLTVDEEKELCQKIAEGDSNAKKEFTERNLKLVVSIAKKYTGRGLDLLDLIQEGNLGLMNAVDRYDVNKGFKFSTYATWWIKQSIVRGIAEKGRNIRVPVHVYEKINAYNKTVTNLDNKLGRMPTIDEIANEMGIEPSKVINICKIKDDTTSINKKIKDEDETELEELISSNEQSPEEIAINNTLNFQVQNLFEKCNLNDKEIDVLMLRFGINISKPMTLYEVGLKYNVSRERIRQIEAKAFMKIRKSKYVKELAEYMENPESSFHNIIEVRKQYFVPKNSYKSYLSINVNKEMENKKMNKIPTIYQYFKEYSKEQVDEMISNLSIDDKTLLLLRYGNDLSNPVKTDITKSQINKFYNNLVPKMRKMLIDGSTSKIKEPEIINEPINTNSKNNLNLKEKAIISLRYLYNYDIKDIAEFLGIEELEVIEIIKSVLEYYKDKLNSLIEKVSEEQQKLKRS